VRKKNFFVISVSTTRATATAAATAARRRRIFPQPRQELLRVGRQEPVATEAVGKVRPESGSGRRPAAAGDDSRPDAPRRDLEPQAGGPKEVGHRGGDGVKGLRLYQTFQGNFFIFFGSALFRERLPLSRQIRWLVFRKQS
jgi:hypothetical protein